MEATDELNKMAENAPAVKRAKNKYYLSTAELVEFSTQKELLVHLEKNQIDPAEVLIIQGRPKRFVKELQPKYSLN